MAVAARIAVLVAIIAPAAASEAFCSWSDASCPTQQLNDIIASGLAPADGLGRVLTSSHSTQTIAAGVSPSVFRDAVALLPEATHRQAVLTVLGES